MRKKLKRKGDKDRVDSAVLGTAADRGIGVDKCGDDNSQCLVCYSSSNVETSKVSSVLSRQLDVYFILRHVLELPLDQLILYLKHCSKPEEWIKICSVCNGTFVKECKQVYGELLEAKRKYAAVRLKFTEAIKRAAQQNEQRSLQIGGEGGGGSSDSPRRRRRQLTLVDIPKETREFVLRHEYYNFDGNLDITGDLVAGKKLLAETAGKVAIGGLVQKQSIDGDFGQKTEKINQDDQDQDNEIKVKIESLLAESDCDFEEESMFTMQQSENGNCDSIEDNLTSELFSGNSTRGSTEGRNHLPLPPSTSTCKNNQLSVQNRNTSRPQRSVVKLATRNNTFPNGDNENDSDEDEDEDWAEANLSADGGISGSEDEKNKNINSTSKSKASAQKKYKCKECGWKTTSSPSLQEHKKRLHGNEMDLLNRTCPICQKVLSSVRHRRRHIARCHAEDKSKVQCEHCGKEYSDKRTLRLHMCVAHPAESQLEPFRCSIEGCDKAFAVKSGLVEHMDFHNPDGFKCDTCEKVLPSRKRLRLHILSKHENTGERSIHCDLCPAKFTAISGLKSHIKFVHSSVEKKRRRRVIIHQCTRCEDFFYFHKRLREHMEKAHGLAVQEELFSCPQCVRTFTNKSKLERHIEISHEKKRQVCCEICGKTLLSPFNLKVHKLRVHRIGSSKELSRAECSVEGCKKTFKCKSELSKHIRSRHEGVRKYQCDHCGRNFIARTHLNRHILAVHTNRESKPFKCNECGKDFAIVEYLLQHKRGYHANKDLKQENT